MKVINNLVVVEVPKESRNHQIIGIGVAKYCQWDIGLATGVDKLPFPCTIIGLATKIDLEQTRYVLRESGAKLWSVGTAKRIMYKVLADQHGVDVSFTHDLLFLKRI